MRTYICKYMYLYAICDVCRLVAMYCMCVETYVLYGCLMLCVWI